jgi:cytochrome d ubiquinol oxidase subunit II
MIIFWVAVLALTTLLYVILDGFDLGVGILFGFTRNEELRRKMLSAISPVWDGNETWLIFTGTILFGAFPRVYATLLSAFYLPITLMLGALILRGVAFEFRYKATSTRWLWDLGFCGGSLIASFVQGVTVGALVEGLPMQDGQYVGGTFGWLSPFACLCGIGLCFGYALLGAGWLTAKCEGILRARARALLRPLTIGVFSFLAVAFVYALVLDLRIMNRWIERPYLLIFPAIGAVAAVFLVRGISDQNDGQPGTNLPFGVRDARHLVLAVHDTVCRDHRPGRGAALKPVLHVLGSRTFRSATHPHVHRCGLSRVSREDR